MSTILYKWPECWGLPSSDVPCIQLEAYLRFTSHSFLFQPCSSPSSSPTGQLPALEHDNQIANPRSEDGDTFKSARSAMFFLKEKGHDLDSHLNPTQKAELVAFHTLFETKLNPATSYSIWYESSGYAEWRKAVTGADIPFPLNWVVPAFERRKMQTQLGKLDDDKVYRQACQVLTVLADRLRHSGTPYLLGAKPSSADAVLLGHLLFYHTSPAAAPVLREQVGKLLPLQQYINSVMEKHFSTQVPQAPEQDPATSSWSDAAQGIPRIKKTELTEAEKAQRQWSKWWLGGVAAAMGGYMLFSGRYLEFVEVGGGEDDDNGDDDDDDVE